MTKSDYIENFKTEAGRKKIREEIGGIWFKNQNYDFDFGDPDEVIYIPENADTNITFVCNPSIDECKAAVATPEDVFTADDFRELCKASKEKKISENYEAYARDIFFNIDWTFPSTALIDEEMYANEDES